MRRMILLFVVSAILVLALAVPAFAAPGKGQGEGQFIPQCRSLAQENDRTPREASFICSPADIHASPFL